MGWSLYIRGATMKLLLLFASLFTIGALVAAQTDGSGVVHVDAGKVAAALAKGGSLVTRPDLLVSGSHREKGGQVEVHDKETDVLYIVDGEATFVYGGQMVGGKVTQPGQWLGSDITGGQTHHIAQGGLFVLPAGGPPLFKGGSHVVHFFLPH